MDNNIDRNEKMFALESRTRDCGHEDNLFQLDLLIVLTTKPAVACVPIFPTALKLPTQKSHDYYDNEHHQQQSQEDQTYQKREKVVLVCQATTTQS